MDVVVRVVGPLIFLLGIPLLIFYLRHLGRSAGATNAATSSPLGKPASSFFALTGYRYADATDHAIEAQDRRASAEGPAILEGRFRVHYVRERGGLHCEFQQATFFKSQLAGFPGGASAAHEHGSYHLPGGRHQPSTYTLCRWRVTAPQPPRLLLHVAERSLGGARLLSAGDRPWRARAPHPVATTHLPALDRRFQVYTSDPEAAVAVLQSNPACVARLLKCVEVDVWTDAQGAEFNDAQTHNLFGGHNVMLRVAVDQEEMVHRMARNHDQIADLLAELLRATS